MALREGILLSEVPDERDRLAGEARTILDRATGDTLSPDDQARFNEIETDLDQLRQHEQNLQRRQTVVRAANRGTVEHGDGATVGSYVNTRDRNPYRYDDPALGQVAETRARALDALERSGLDAASGDRASTIIETSSVFAARFLAGSDPAYERAFLKMLRDPQLGQGTWTEGERNAFAYAQRTAMSVGTDANGGYMVPTHLDPTIILTSSGWENPLRGLAREVTLAGGNTWNGVTSAGVTASFDTELTEVSDDTPNDLARVSIDTHRAQALIQYSIESEQDIESLRSELGMLLADAKGDLESAKFSTGSGTNEPTGIWTALDANTNVEITSTTAAVVGEVDLHNLYRNVPIRWRRRGSWLMNPLYSLAIKRLGTAVSSTFSGDLREPVTERILGRPMIEDDDAPTTQTTTALDPEVIYGDFSNFVIVDKPASMTIELVPHMLGANRRPIGARGLYAYWRTGSDSVNDSAFRLLLDKTSA